jgi:hypothetical protein
VWLQTFPAWVAAGWLILVAVPPGPLLPGPGEDGADAADLATLADPAVVMGVVQIAENGAILVSDESGVVAVAPSELGRQLLALEGEIVLIKGRLLGAERVVPTILAREIYRSSRKPEQDTA